MSLSAWVSSEPLTGRPATRRSLAAVAVALSSGCALNAPSYVDESAITADGLYAGEPVAVHATELPVTSSAEGKLRAQAALAEGDIDLALYLYVQASNLDPNDTEALYAIGAIHENKGNFDLAVRAFSRVTELKPDDALAQQGLGLAHFNARQFLEARPPLQAAVAIDATLWRSHNALGILADRDERYDAAIDHYTAAIQSRPNSASIRNNRGYSKYLAGDLEASKRDFLAAIDIDPSYELAWRNIGLVYAREQDYTRALNAMKRAMPEHVALNDVGYIAMLDGNYRIAQTYFENAVIVSPRHYQTAQDNLVELRRRSVELVAAEDD